MSGLPGLAAVLALAAAAALAQPAASAEREKVVYEMPTRTSARVVLDAVARHLDASPAPARIAVVAHGSGVEAMLTGARDAGGKPYSESIERLAGRGVDFAVCGSTLELRHIDASRVLPQGRVVPSGNAELDRLEHEGYVRLN